MRPIRFIGCTLMLIPLTQGCGGDEQAQQAAPPPPDVTISQVVSREVTDSWEFTGRTDRGVHRFYESCGFKQSKTGFEIRAA